MLNQPYERRKGDIATSPSTLPTMKCFKCHRYEHIVSNFPNMRAIYFSEQGLVGEIYIDDSREDRIKDECQLSIVWERLLVLRVLQIELKKEQFWLKYIFCTICTVKGNICTLIINGDCYENIVLTYLVEKLNLSTQRYSLLYSLMLLNMGTKICVDKRCLVEFFIGDKL